MIRFPLSRALLSLCLLAGNVFARQSDTSKETAIQQMRQIVKAIKSCHEELESKLDTGDYYYGPPSNVEWDVKPSTAVRSPFQGWVTFVLPRRSVESDKAKHSKQLHERYMLIEATHAAYGHSGHFRYEFDLGAEAPELVKMLWIDDTKQDNVDQSHPVSQSHECWQESAQMRNAH